MENSNTCISLKRSLTTITLIILSIVSVNAQISTPCTTSMITSFTPCINFITGSISSGSSPTTGCCDSIRSLMSNSRDCTCLLITGNVPFALPINQTLALSLPSACQSDGVPIQCKASGVPLPAPGPVLFRPTLPPSAAASPFSPRASKTTMAAPAPIESTLAAAPVSPTATPGIRPVLTPTSDSNPSYVPLLSFLVLVLTSLTF